MQPFHTYVVTTSIPDPVDKIYVPTRLIVGEPLQAHAIYEALRRVGYDARIDEETGIPARPDDEIKRAGHLMALLFATPRGSIQ